MTLKGARPFKVKLHLICLNNKCFDFKPIKNILILIVTDPGPVISELQNGYRGSYLWPISAKMAKSGISPKIATLKSLIQYLFLKKGL